MPVTERTLKVVWGQCAARCCICKKDLLHTANGTVASLIGEVAHIVGETDSAARGRSILGLKERNEAGNLLLLCREHHKVVDDDPATYPVDRLSRIKDEHLAWIASSLVSPRAWKSNISQLTYINVPRLCEQAEVCGYRVDLSHYKDDRTLHGLGWELNHVMAAFQTVLAHLSVDAIPLESVVLHESVVGAAVSFDRKLFRTKNVPMEMPELASRGVKFTGSLVRDPHIYCGVSGCKVVMLVDPRWITTSSAFMLFRPSSGQSFFSGLGRITSVNYEAGIILVTPWVLGVPRSSFEKAALDAAVVPRMGEGGTASLDSLVHLEEGKKRDVYFNPPPAHCDLCGKSLSNDQYMIDGAVRDLRGAWACMCGSCFNSRGLKIGWGHGQLYLKDEKGWLNVAGFPQS